VPRRRTQLRDGGVDRGLVAPAQAPAVEPEEGAQARPVAEQDLVLDAMWWMWL